jgi:hypothetical protein
VPNGLVEARLRAGQGVTRRTQPPTAKLRPPSIGHDPLLGGRFNGSHREHAGFADGLNDIFPWDCACVVTQRLKGAVLSVESSTFSDGHRTLGRVGEGHSTRASVPTFHHIVANWKATTRLYTFQTVFPAKKLSQRLRSLTGMIDMYRAQKSPRPGSTDQKSSKHNYLLTDLNILKLPRLPARLTTEEAAFLLRIEEQDIPWIVDAGILSPCGQPAHKAQKWYSTVDVLTLMENPDKLSEMTQVISGRWAEKNARRPKNKNGVETVSQEAQDDPKSGGQ